MTDQARLSAAEGYLIGKLFFAATSGDDGRLVAAFREDPAAVVAEFGLSDAASRAVLDHDLRTIYESGVHPLLVRMGANALYGPMPTPDYRAALTGAVQIDH